MPSAALLKSKLRAVTRRTAIAPARAPARGQWDHNCPQCATPIKWALLYCAGCIWRKVPRLNIPLIDSHGRMVDRVVDAHPGAA